MSFVRNGSAHLINANYVYRHRINNISKMSREFVDAHVNLYAHVDFIELPLMPDRIIPHGAINSSPSRLVSSRGRERAEPKRRIYIRVIYICVVIITFHLSPARAQAIDHS